LLHGLHAQAGQHRLKPVSRIERAVRKTGSSSEEPSWKLSLGALQAGGHEGAKTKTAVERRQINARSELNRRLGGLDSRLSASRMKSGGRALTHCGQKKPRPMQGLTSRKTE
jgi:hypothetical protein